MNTTAPRLSPRPMGAFLPVDAEGYLVNDCRADHVPPALAALVIEHYRQSFGAHLRSVYVRGSVARGTAVDGVSDLDTFAVVDDAASPSCPLLPPELLERLHAAAPGLADFEFHACRRSAVTGSYYSTWAFLVKTQSACLHGEDLGPALAPYRVGPELMAEALYLRQRLALYAQRLAAEQQAPPPQQIATCQWFMKALVRAAFDLTLDRARRYTRDLYPCYATFAELYPERGPDCWRALEWAISPTPDTEPQRQLAEDFGHWICDEADVVARRNGIDPSRYVL
ncbi:hypothetical protein [Caldimonas brevitalea]|uniref:Polymerase nucleotidyl transferase domain-containing protein n=1 Tax=Caldimonas brevitalea TaxID=413882 RepID=A0A0G3BNC2_9BURK|nr:hypothetical protein [Caldimonas brevitalea]AKJ30949.1 hypothetical protein AAW51_4258 [Caldimonas brevitalea]